MRVKLVLCGLLSPFQCDCMGDVKIIVWMLGRDLIFDSNVLILSKYI